MKYSLLVDDNGNSHHKVAFMKDGEIHTHKEKTIIRDGSKILSDEQGVAQDVYMVDQKKYICNEQISGKISTRNESYQMSPENKALIAHTLLRSGALPENECPIILGVTLPWNNAFDTAGNKNVERIQSVSDYYSNTVIDIIGLKKKVSITHAQAYAEGHIAFYDWAIEDNGSIERALKISGPIAVIDIGGSTTDIVTLLSSGGKLTIDHNRSDNDQIGVMDAKDQVKASIITQVKDTHNVDIEAGGGVADFMIESAFKAGNVKIGALEPVDVKQCVENAKAQTVEKIVNFIKATIQNPYSYEAVIFVGGGAVLFKSVLEKIFPTAFYLDEFATAKGALKYMMKIDRKRLEGELDKLERESANLTLEVVD